jgi:uncharacterized protein (TIGR02231 family)
MRHRIARLAPVALLAFASVTRAADVAAHLSIARVTVHRDSAIVIRAGSVELPAGEHRLVMRNLPDGIAPAGIRLKADSRGIRLGGIEVQRVTQDALVNETERGIHSQMRALNDQKDTIADEIAAAESQLKLLSAVTQAPAGSGEHAMRMDGTTLNALIGSVGTAEAAARTRIRTSKLRLRELDEKLAVLAADLQKVATARKATTELRAHVRADSAGAYVFELEYPMADAGWSWQYEARLDTRTKKVALIRQAELRQGTGEDWKDIELVVSTSRPVNNAATPRIATLFLDLSYPNYDGAGESLDEIVVTGARRGDRNRSYNPRPRPGAAPPAGVAKQTSQSLEADVFATDFVADYRIPGRVTVSSDRQARLYPIGEEQLDVDLVARANLAKSRNAHLEAKTRYAGDVPIDTGVVQLFRDDTFVGVAGLPMVLPQDEMRIPFGVDDRIRVTVREEKADSGDRGIMSRHQVDEHKRRFEITSFHASAIPIEIIDRVPVPQDNDIKVEVLEGGTPPADKSLDGLAGVYLWKLDGSPRKTETIRHYYAVRYPADKVLVPRESH